jgi:hypothetical protein
MKYQKEGIANFYSGGKTGVKIHKGIIHSKLWIVEVNSKHTRTGRDLSRIIDSMGFFSILSKTNAKKKNCMNNFDP